MNDFFTDQPRQCRRCAAAFLWRADEQAYYKKRGGLSAPTHCPAFRQLRQAERAEHGRPAPDPDSPKFSANWVADLPARSRPT